MSASLESGECAVKSDACDAPLLFVFGAGYLGAFVGAAAMGRGWRVRGLTRNREQAAELRKNGWEQVIVADLDRTDWWCEFSETPDYVVNMVSSGGGGQEGYEKSYLGGSRSILAWASQHADLAGLKNATFLYTSSTGVYPDTGGDWVREADVKAESDGRTGILLETEKLVEQKGGGLFGRWFILRLAGLYGPNRAFLVRQLREGAGRVAGSGGYFLNLVRIEDAAAATIAALEAESSMKNRIWNVADGNPALKSEIVSWIGDQLGFAPPYFEPDGSSVNWRGGKNRRISTEAITADLNWRPQFADFRDGFGGLLT